MDDGENRAEAERLLGIAERLLISKDFNASREFAILAQETDPLLEYSDQILAVSDVHLAAEKRINNHHDWYAILQVETRSNNLQLIRQQYRRLVLLLHPNKNHLVFADSAYKLVANAWAVLSDSTNKSLYDKELSLLSSIDLFSADKENDFHERQLPVGQNSSANIDIAASVNGSGGRTIDNRGNVSAGLNKVLNFWTACPYCYNLYEYARIYEECCLKCQNCMKAFTAAEITSLPPFVAGKEAYYCNWSFFPMGITFANSEGWKGGVSPNWIPGKLPSFGANNETGMVGDESTGGVNGSRRGFVDFAEGNMQPTKPFPKTRGRPRKNV